MAYSEEQWKEAKFLYEIECKGPTFIQDATGISKAQISKTAKKEGWEKETPKTRLKSNIVEFEKKEETQRKQKETIVSTVSLLDDFEITMLKDALKEEGFPKSIIFSTALLASVRINETLTKNKKTVGMRVKQYVDGRVDGETVEPFEMPLSPSDVKDCIEGNDKAAITLGVAERHAPKTEIQNTNATQNNYTLDELSKAVADGLPD
jgi:hypothetical protein